MVCAARAACFVDAADALRVGGVEVAPSEENGRAIVVGRVGHCAQRVVPLALAVQEPATVAHHLGPMAVSEPLRDLDALVPRVQPALDLADAHEAAAEVVVGPGRLE